ncbi:MAG: hypothetical protein ACWGQW_23300 [bacterium]
MSYSIDDKMTRDIIDSISAGTFFQPLRPMPPPSEQHLQAQSQTQTIGATYPSWTGDSPPPRLMTTDKFIVNTNDHTQDPPKITLPEVPLPDQLLNGPLHGHFESGYSLAVAELRVANEQILERLARLTNKILELEEEIDFLRAQARPSDPTDI